MEQETHSIEQTCFVPLSGSDAVIYLVIASQVKVAAHEDVQADKLHYVGDLRSIIAMHKQHFRTEVDDDGSISKSTSREVIEQMEHLLQRLDDAGLWMCFRMWSILNAKELVHFAVAEAEAVDTDGNSEVAQRQSDSDGYGAIVGFLIVSKSLPVMIPDSGNGHWEICISQVPDWDVVPDELAQG